MAAFGVLDMEFCDKTSPMRSKQHSSMIYYPCKLTEASIFLNCPLARYSISILCYGKTQPIMEAAQMLV